MTRPARTASMFAAIAVLSALTPTATAATLYVSTTGNDANDGLTWPTAKQTVQAALNAATSGDHVWVAAGTYVENITLADGVALYGGFAGTEDPTTFQLDDRNFTANETILDGNHYRSVVTALLLTSPNSAIDGFTIRNGDTTDGGGIFCSERSVLLIKNNKITGNNARDGAGIYCGESSSPTILNNVIIANYAEGRGGGIYTDWSSSPSIINNTIVLNRATVSGGGGIYCYYSSFTIVNTIVAFNSSGIHKYIYTAPFTLSNNCVYGNDAYDYYGLGEPTGIDGNISVDPQLADMHHGNAHIQPGSPCRDAGNNDYVMTSEDIDGQPRIQPVGGTVDIGADESDGSVWSPVPSKVFLVAPNGKDWKDGLSWLSAKKTVQAALDVALPGDRVWVAAGAYIENITLKRGVALYGGFAGIEDPASFNLADRKLRSNETILDGNRAGSVVTLPQYAAESTRIDGFTIRNGYSSTGGGIYCYNSSPTIANNRITRNDASLEGGGIYCWSSSPAIINSMITANGAASGGGVYCTQYSSPTMVNNTITGNNATYKVNTQSGGALYIGTNASVVIANTIIAFNSSGIKGWLGFAILKSNCVYGNGEYDYWGIEDPTGTEGNISADPELVDAAYGNLHVQPNSPCVDAGDNAYVQGDTDVDGQPRIHTAGGTVDIGADESDATTWPEGPYGIVRVAPHGNDANDGTSWDLAKQTVQAAIDAASSLGGEVWVEAGIYNERITLDPYVYLYGGFTGTENSRDERDWTTNSTILDGQASGSVVTVCAGFQISTIDGFTIRNGSGTVMGALTYGGGIYCRNSSSTIVNNTVVANNALFGGGIYCSGSYLSIENNTILANSAGYLGGGGIACYESSGFIQENVIRDNSANGYDSHGGGIYFDWSSPAVVNNTITGNSAIGDNSNGGGIYARRGSPRIASNIITINSAASGGGFCGSSSAPTIVSNTISQNSSAKSGGGIYVNGAYYMTIIADNVISDNEVTGSTSAFGGGISCLSSAPMIVNNMILANNVSGADYSRGGGLFISGKHTSMSPTLLNNTIAANSASMHGGGIYCTSSFPSIINTTIVTNIAPNGSVLACDSNSQMYPSGLVVKNSIVRSGPDWFWNNDNSTVTIAYSNVQHGWPGAGNIDADPLFIQAPDPGPDGQWGTPDDDLGDLRLQPGSPCIDAADNAAVPPDTADLDNDGDTAEPTPLDLAGAPRFADDPATPDTGAGAPPIVDMGAYEYQPPSPADFDQDGDVDADDLATFAACATGPAIPYTPETLPPTCPLTPDAQGHIPADFDQDHDIDQADFAQFQRHITGENDPPIPSDAAFPGSR